MTSVYLHKNIIETFSLFGDYKEKMLEVLNAIADGYIELPPISELTKYSIPIDKDVKRIELDIPDYIIDILPNKIRATLYWFIEEEVYSEIGWTLNPSKSRWFYGRLSKAINSLRLLEKVVDYTDKQDIELMIEKLNSIGDENGKTKSNICKTESEDRTY